MPSLIFYKSNLNKTFDALLRLKKKYLSALPVDSSTQKMVRRVMEHLENIHSVSGKAHQINTALSWVLLRPRALHLSSLKADFRL